MAGDGAHLSAELSAAAALIPVGAGPRCRRSVSAAARQLEPPPPRPALASMLAYPFLTLCDAAVFEIRISFGSAMWALSETALLTVLLSRFPGGKMGAARCGGSRVWLESDPSVGKGGAVYYYNSRSTAGYLPVLWEMVHRRMNRDPPIFSDEREYRAQNMGWAKKYRKCEKRAKKVLTFGVRYSILVKLTWERFFFRMNLRS